MNLDALIVKKGEPTRPKYNALVEWFRRSSRTTTGASIRSRRGPDGISYIADTRGTGGFIGAWRVRLSGLAATVGEGTVNTLIPSINGVPITGVDARGKAIPPPSLKLLAPGENLRSYIVLRVEVDDSTGELVEERITIEHTGKLEASVFSTIGQHPLAVVVWQDQKSIARVHQLTYFDLQHVFVKATTGKVARHLFWPQ